MKNNPPDRAPAASPRTSNVAVKGRHKHQEQVEKLVAITTRLLTGRRGTPDHPDSPSASRETVESIVVAVILAFLFRAFIAEAFVIPTGSMAPTLQGRHLDIVCPECGYQYRTGASRENERTFRGDYNLVTASTCPICRYTLELDRSRAGTSFLALTNRDSFTGDRILVSKFAYQLAEPDRWDVIVFKYPGNAKQNYIKRLVGLPGESIVIRHGDIYIRDQQTGQQTIARKDHAKLAAMLQLVDDTQHIARELKRVGWPSRWQQESAVPDANQWQISEDGSKFRLEAENEISWLRYRHLVPDKNDWAEIERTGSRPARLGHYRGQLIMDYYAYNDADPDNDSIGEFGSAWVGDLAIDCDVTIESPGGNLILKLVEGGTHYECRIDVKEGHATLSIDGGARQFEGPDGKKVKFPSANVRVNRPGDYRLRFANVDDRLYLWVNGRPVEFSDPTTFVSPADMRPAWRPDEPGDQAPLGIGGRNIKLHVNRLQVLRDIYYLALQTDHARSEHNFQISQDQIRSDSANPRSWATSPVFSSRREAQFTLEEDQFFPLGDNSPQSKDARLWSNYGNSETGYFDPPPHVKREYLIGKAVLIYWPHAWRPFWPNFARMGVIR